jgi:hypothetical protein
MGVAVAAVVASPAVLTALTLVLAPPAAFGVMGNCEGLAVGLGAINSSKFILYSRSVL